MGPPLSCYIFSPFLPTYETLHGFNYTTFLQCALELLFIYNGFICNEHLAEMFEGQQQEEKREK
jgi:hypothetical protein